MTLWKPISCAPQYEISEDGTVKRRLAGKNSPVGKVLRTTRHHYGYPRVCLTIHGKNVKFEVHKLVALTFIGPKPFPKAEVAHRDGDPRNNHFCNLEWASHKENESHKRRHGTSPQGQRNAQSKLTNEDVLKIREASRTRSLTSIADQFGVTFQTVSKIKNNKSWSWLNDG